MKTEEEENEEELKASMKMEDKNPVEPEHQLCEEDEKYESDYYDEESEEMEELEASMKTEEKM